MSLNPTATPSTKIKYVRFAIAAAYTSDAKPCANKPDRFMRFAVTTDAKGVERKLVVFGSAEDFASCAEDRVIVYHAEGKPEDAAFAPKALAEARADSADFVAVG